MHPEKIAFTNAMIDLFQPFKLNLAVYGPKNCGKTTLLYGLVEAATNFT